MYPKNLSNVIGTVLVIAAYLCFSSSVTNGALRPSEKELTIGVADGVTEGPPFLTGEFDAAGYSDYILWGQSPRHTHGFHEMLSGEWGAAIYYDGIHTDLIDPNDPNTPESPREAMWLTDWFLYPYWYTNSDFWILSNPTAWGFFACKMLTAGYN
jgi:hypothetical protein